MVKKHVVLLDSDYFEAGAFSFDPENPEGVSEHERSEDEMLFLTRLLNNYETKQGELHRDNPDFEGYQNIRGINQLRGPLVQVIEDHFNRHDFEVEKVNVGVTHNRFSAILAGPNPDHFTLYQAVKLPHGMRVRRPGEAAPSLDEVECYLVTQAPYTNLTDAEKAARDFRVSPDVVRAHQAYREAIWERARQYSKIRNEVAEEVPQMPPVTNPAP